MTDFERPTGDPTPGEPTTSPPKASNETDTTAVPVATEPIAAPQASAAAQKPNRARWFAAASLIALVIGATTLIILSLTASTSSSVVLGYVPADSTMYGELRLDLPGDQRQKVGQFLSKFPGFADQAALETKLDEVLDRLTSESSKGKQRYTTDIKPWFDGQLAFSVGPIPAAAASDPSAMAKSFRALLLISVKDAALAKTWFSKVFADAGITGTQETYQGTELTLFADPKAPDLKVGFGVVGGKVAIVGDAASVRAAVDTKGAGGLAKAPGFAAADGALKGDDVGFVYVDMKALMDASLRISKSMSSAPPVSDALLAMVPEWTAMRLRVEGDALLMDSVLPHMETGPNENHPNGVAAYAPPSTVALFSGNDYGAILKKMFAVYRNEPTFADGFKQLDQAAGLIGGLDASVGWMGDSGVVVAKVGETVEGGLVSIPADAAAGRQLLTQVRSLLQLGGQQAGITVREESYNGQTITIVDLGSFRDLAGIAGALGGLPPGVDGTGQLPDGHAEIAYVASDQVVAIGSSPDFVKHVLDAGAGASLADDARFQGLLGRVDSSHSGLLFLDIANVRGMMESAMSSATAQERAAYEESVKPFLTPFDALIGTGTVSPSVDQAHYVITVK
jgi:uncharacterized protein DUF3352